MVDANDLPPRSDEEGEVSWDWGKVGKALVECGVNGAQELIEHCKHQLTPTDVGMIIRHWRSRPGAWESGALYFRIRNAQPAAPPDRNWPPPREPPPSPDQQQAETEREMRERLAWKIITQGRKRGKSDEEITALLELRGIDWEGKPIA